jgi:hypothetical protein
MISFTFAVIVVYFGDVALKPVLTSWLLASCLPSQLLTLSVKLTDAVIPTVTVSARQVADCVLVLKFCL